jgi:hypothetical protein
MKTAVEWLAEQVNSAKWKFADVTDRNAIIEQAKQMEEDQLLTTWWEPKDKSFQDYYNQTFKK